MDATEIGQAIGIFVLCFGVSGVTMMLIHRMDQRSREKETRHRHRRRKRDK
jgi:amino acid permease